MIKIPITVLVLCFTFSLSQAQNRKVVCGDKISIKGKIQVVKEKDNVWGKLMTNSYLLVDHPLDMSCGVYDDCQPVVGIRKTTIIFNKGDLSKFNGKHVLVSGNLGSVPSAHYHTETLFQVENISLAQ
jgi:hypothetical protein